MFDAGYLSPRICFYAEKPSLAVKDGDVAVKLAADHCRTRAVRVHGIGARRGKRHGRAAVLRQRGLYRKASLLFKGDEPSPRAASRSGLTIASRQIAEPEQRAIDAKSSRRAIPSQPR